MATPKIENPGMTPSLENYLEAIYEQDRAGGARVTDIAATLHVSKASVHRAMTSLKEIGYVRQERYGTLKLTEDGLRHAVDVSGRHAMIKRFLVELVGVDEETADADACRVEHVISPQTTRKWTEYVNGVLKNEG